QGSAQRVHRWRGRAAAVRRRCDAAVLHERRGARGQERLRGPARSRFLQVPATAVTQVRQQDLLTELLPTLRAFAIPMRTKFRGITGGEGALLGGPAGWWGEFAPFAEYGPQESARWLASAIESAAIGWPAPIRDEIGVNATVPAVGPQAAHEIA